jgi:glycine/D-amino acid oxidase-like deaminating enzyme
MKICVVGAGIVGLWVAAEASKSGHKVELIEKYEIGHDKGSSHGDTRIFRTAYWEGSEYVALAKQSIDMWEWLSTTGSERVFSKIGGYYVGKEESSLITGVMKSSQMYDLPIDTHSISDVLGAQAQEGITISEDLAGVVYADKALQTLKSLCIKMDVNVRENTTEENLDSDVVVYCKGPWSVEIPRLANVLSSNRVYCHWFKHNAKSKLFEKVFLVQGLDGRVLYGMPVTSDIVKVGWHNYPIIPLRPGLSENSSPNVYIDDIKDALCNLLNTELVHIRSKGCYFTNSLDENYIVDNIDENKWVICGLSGHGFKFAPALARNIVMAIDKTSEIEVINPFRLSRFANAVNTIPRTHVQTESLLLGKSWDI